MYRTVISRTAQRGLLTLGTNIDVLYRTFNLKSGQLMSTENLFAIVIRKNTVSTT